MSNEKINGRKTAAEKNKRRSAARLYLMILAAICAALMSSCGKELKKDVARTSVSADTVASAITQTGTLRRIQKKNGPLLGPYDSLVSTGEYTLKITVNEIIGGESIPTVTTSIHHDGKIRIKVEESYDSSILYFLEENRLYYFTENGEKRSMEYEVPLKNIYLYDSDLEFLSDGEMTLYGNDYSYESYIDENGTEVRFLFGGNTLERKLVYKNASDEFTAYTVELTENAEDADKLFG